MERINWEEDTPLGGSCPTNTPLGGEIPHWEEDITEVENKPENFGVKRDTSDYSGLYIGIGYIQGYKESSIALTYISSNYQRT